MPRERSYVVHSRAWYAKTVPIHADPILGVYEDIAVQDSQFEWKIQFCTLAGGSVIVDFFDEAWVAFTEHRDVLDKLAALSEDARKFDRLVTPGDVEKVLISCGFVDDTSTVSCRAGVHDNCHHDREDDE